jgi:hypothetical protein
MKGQLMRHPPKSGKVGHIQLEMSPEERRDNFIAAAIVGMTAHPSYNNSKREETAKAAIKIADIVMDIITKEEAKNEGQP